MISCKDATLLILKREGGESIFGYTDELTEHVSMCSSCQLFEKQSSLVSSSLKNFTSNNNLCVEDKFCLVKALKRE